MIRILQVLGSLQRGGAETMIMNIYRNVDRNEIQFDFLVKEHVENGYEEEVKEMGGKIFVVESPKKIGIFKYIKKQCLIMKNNEYKIVHSHMNTLSGLTLLAAKLAKVEKRIAHSHNTIFEGGISEKIGKYLIKFFATERISCGYEAGKALFLKKEFVIIPNGIITEKFLNDKEQKKIIRSKLGINNSVVNICHIGRFSRVKNHDFIIKLCQNLDADNFKYNMYLLGNGEDLFRIRDLANSKKMKNIKFIGSVTNANEYLKASDLFILPSLHEGLPVTLVEAQCAGVSCLISNYITKEVDFELGLINYMELDIEQWTNFIEQKKYLNISVDAQIVKEHLKNRFYDIKISSIKLLEIYGI